MSLQSNRALYWAPRLLALAFILFLSLFALDVFEHHRGFWPTLQALLLHLIPSLVLTLALALAWRWEWIGTAVFGSAGALYIVWVASLTRPVPPAMRLLWIATIAGPAFLISGLFLAGWLHRRPHAPHHP